MTPTKTTLLVFLVMAPLFAQEPVIESSAISPPSIFSLNTIFRRSHLKWAIFATMVTLYWQNPHWMNSVSLYASDLSRGILHAPDHLAIKGFVLLSLNAGFAAREIWNLRHRRAA